MRSLFLAVMVFLCLASVSQAAKHDTSFTFSTIETQHFSIHYHQGLESMARRLAAMAEEVHAKVVKEFLWHPSEKTQVLLLDDSDFTSGLSVTIPYNVMYLHVAPPSLASTLGEYDDWLKVLFTHEYTHIVTSDPARGYSKATRSIFGKPLPADPLGLLFFLAAAPPNTFLPRWWHEGMATWSETEFTGQGRGKGTYYDMVYRMDAVQGSLPRVDEINGDRAKWPDGHLAYIYGYRLQRYLSDTYGKDALGRLSIAHAGRLPYLIGRPPESIFGGKSYSELFGDMISALKAEQSRRVAVLSRAPFTRLQTISKNGEILTYPRYSPDGSRIAYTRLDPHDHARTVITDGTGARVMAEFDRKYSDGSSSWSPDGSTLYFTQGQVRKGFNVFQDLYAFDLSRGCVKRLTRGKRIGEAEISPDGKLFAAVASSRGSENLELIDAKEPEEKGSIRVLTSYEGERVSSPHWSPDGRSVCYALTDNAGHTTLRVVEVASGKDKPLFSASYTVAYPVWSRDGRCIFYISDETGVFNLFAYDLAERKSYQATHLLGGAFQPDTSPDGRHVLLSSYDGDGFSVAELTLERSAWSQTRGPSLPLTRTVTPENAPAGAGATETAAKPSHYNPLQTLYPRFWLPRFTVDGSGKVVLGAYTAGADVVGYNSYALAADYSPGRKRGYFDLVYQNDYFYPTLSVKGHSVPFLYSNLLQRGDYWELNQGFSLDASVPVNFLESRYLILAGYELVDQKPLSSLDANGRFDGARVFQGTRSTLYAGIAFDNALRYPYSISFEQGRSVSFVYRRSAPAFGSDLDLSEYRVDYREYLALPTEALKHNVVYLRLAGAVSDSKTAYAQRVFQLGGAPLHLNQDLNPYPLRGYESRSMAGKYLATGTLEYRAPLSYPMRGYKTLPAFLEKLHAALFVDAGEVWDDNNTFSGDKILVGAGVEARTDVTLGYWAKLTPAVGYAHGFNSGGENQIYFTLYFSM